MRVFVLYAQKFWRHKRSVVRRHVIEAVLRHPEVDGIISGPGWAEYNESLTVRDNMERLLPSADVCWVYKQDGNPSLGIPGTTGLDKVQALRVTRFHEFWWVTDPKMAAQAKQETRDIDLVLYTHENDGERFDQFGVKSAHIPQTCDASIFRCDVPLRHRPIPCLLTGTLGREHYPLRVRLANMITSNMIPGVIRKAPPCWVDNAQLEAESYARHLKDAKIALCCTSKWKYALGKQIEAAMSGCIVATDMPQDSLFESTIGKYIIRLDSQASDDENANAICEVLEDENTANRLVEGSRRESLKFTNEEYANRFVEVVGGML